MIPGSAGEEIVEVQVLHKPKGFYPKIGRYREFTQYDRKPLEGGNTGHTRFPVSLPDGKQVAAHVYWRYGMPSDAAVERWKPIIETAVRAFVAGGGKQAVSSSPGGPGSMGDTVMLTGLDPRETPYAEIAKVLEQLRSADYRPMLDK